MHGLQADHIVAASCGEQAFPSNTLDGCIAAVARKLEFFSWRRQIGSNRKLIKRSGPKAESKLFAMCTGIFGGAASVLQMSTCRGLSQVSSLQIT